MVNFLALEYRDDGENLAAGLSGTFGMYHTFGICAIRQKRLTKFYIYDILIISQRDIDFANSKRWTWQARNRKNALIYIMYKAHGNTVTARTEKEKVKSRYEKIILSEKPFLLNKTACKWCCACAIIGVAEQ